LNIGEFGEMKKPIAAIYARVSLDRDNKSESVDNQIRLLKEFANQKDFVVSDDLIYQETISATSKSAWERPEMKKLLEDARQNKFQVALFKGISRMTRNTREALELLEIFKQYDVRVLSFEEGFDSSRDDSTFLFGIHALLAQQEAEKLAVRVRLGQKEMLKKGGWVGGAPYGYKLVNGHLEVVEEEAKLVRKIFELYAKKGIGAGTIAEQLNSNGHRTRNGRLWSRKTVLDILKNRVYIGEVVTNKYIRKKIRDSNNKIKQSKKLRDPSEWIIIKSQPAIVDKTLFEQANQQLKKKSFRIEPRNVKYPLVGLLKCGECGSKWHARSAKTNGKLYTYYVCNGKTYGYHHCSQSIVTHKALDDYVLDRLREKLNTVKELIKINPDAFLKSDVQKLEKELKDVNKKIEKVNRDTSDLYFERDNLEEEQYNYIRDQLKQKAKILIEKKAELEKQLHLAQQGEERQKLIQQYIDEFFQLSPDDTKQVRRVIHHFIKEIVIKDGHLDIYYNFDF
jgi:site-specific DNA recombinase